MSPKILEEKGLIFWFHSYDALHEDRASVHVSRGKPEDAGSAKIWLEPEIEVARPGRNLNQHELKLALEIIRRHQQRMLERWYAHKRRSG